MQSLKSQPIKEFKQRKDQKLFFLKWSLVLLCILISLGTYAKPHLKFSIKHYDYDYFNKAINEFNCICGHSGNTIIKTNTGKWNIRIDTVQIKKGVIDFSVGFYLEEGYEKSSNVGVDLIMDNWKKTNYVLLPAAAYDGNRFESRKIAYCPNLFDPRDIGKDMPIIISDVPRLEIGDGYSSIQERTGSMSVPSIGIYDKTIQSGFFLLTEQANSYGDYGINICENRNRNEAVLSIRSPLVRELYKYKIATMMDVTPDKPSDFKKGDKIVFHFRIYDFHSERLQGLFDKFIEIRHDMVGQPSYENKYPFSNCFSIQEEKFNKQNFVSQWGYYSVGMRESISQDWQIGWTGGMISTYPLLFAGNAQSRENVIRNFNWLFPNGIAPSGFFWGYGEKGNRWWDDRHLIRKSGDGVFYILKQFMLMRKEGIAVDSLWENGTKKVADRLVQLWNQEHQFGQFVDNETGALVIGGSTSGAIIPAALCLVSDYFHDKSYLDIAEASAKYMYENFVIKGFTTGGPGDALQSTDSESSYAMLESFIHLYEYTGKSYWLQCATDMANQFSTWVMAYDYAFPLKSTFYKLGMKSTGAVFANIQNKHGAPGICTHSGAALLKLYRATGDCTYLELLKEIAHNMPQYMSRKERPIGNMPPGWVNERVNTTDWLEPIGEIFYGSTWAETSLMLTYVEVPGIYLDFDKRKVVCFDHVNAKIVRINSHKAVLQIENPTDYSANVRILAENAQLKSKPLGENYLYNSISVHLQSKETKTISIVPLCNR